MKDFALGVTATAAADRRTFSDCGSHRYNVAFRRATVPRAIWNGAVLAESDRCEIVEGNWYFPPDAIRPEHFNPGETHMVCG